MLFLSKLHSFLPYLLIFVLAGSTVYGFYKWGYSVHEKNSIEKENSDFIDTRRNIDEGIRRAPNSSDAATEWLRKRAEERNLN